LIMATSRGDQQQYVTTGGIPNEFELVTKATYFLGGRRRSARRHACRWPARHSSLPCRMRGIPAASIIVCNEFEDPSIAEERGCATAPVSLRRGDNHVGCAVVLTSLRSEHFNGRGVSSHWNWRRR
jgi:hypothetical protein